MTPPSSPLPEPRERATAMASEIVRTLGASLADSLLAGEAVRASLHAIYCGNASPQDWDALRGYLDVLDRNASALGRPL